MSEHAPDDRFQQLQRWLPYAGLAVSLLLSLALSAHTPLHIGLACGLSAATALWLSTMAVPYPVPEGRGRGAAVFVAGFLALIAALLLFDPFFGFFGFTGYLQVALLPRPLRHPAIALNAALMATTQVGGVRHLHSAGGLFAYGCLTVVNVFIAWAITVQGIEEDDRSRRRARVIEELAEANRRLRETMEENAGLHARLLVQAKESGVREERRRMAGEIHDTIAQGLTGIVTQLEAAERFDADPGRRARHRGLAARLAREALAEARRSVAALRPGPLDRAAHLPQALGDLAERWSQTSGVPVRVEVTGEATPLPPDLEVALFRAAQEGLANVARHAAASRAGLTLSYTEDVVVLDVLDDGAGFDPARGAGRPDSYGLTAMRRRLREVGGALAVESAPGDGTALSASVPAARPAPGARTADSHAPDLHAADAHAHANAPGRHSPGERTAHEPGAAHHAVPGAVPVVDNGV